MPNTALMNKLARASTSGIVPHPNFQWRGRRPYAQPSEAPGMYHAETIKRQAVTARWLWQHPDVTAWDYRPDAAGMGLDPWRQIEGVDANRFESEYFLEFGLRSAGVGPFYVVYVQQHDLQRIEDEERADAEAICAAHPS